MHQALLVFALQFVHNLKAIEVMWLYFNDNVDELHYLPVRHRNRFDIHLSLVLHSFLYRIAVLQQTQRPSQYV